MTGHYFPSLSKRTVFTFTISFLASKFLAAENSPQYIINPLLDDLEYGPYTRLVLEILRKHDQIEKNLFEDFKKGHFERGRVSKDLDLLPVEHRSQLDELKRLELHRIRELGAELRRRGEKHGVIQKEVKRQSSHLDLNNLSGFGTEDLRKLLKEATQDIKGLDAYRRQRFKEYEMHKQLELEELKKRLSPEKLDEVERNLREYENIHKRRKPIHLPGSKAHLIKVWEDRDKMSRDNYNTKTFFHMHDLDGNKFLDESEIKILIEEELKEQYRPQDLDFDAKEKAEELERMREYFFSVADLDMDHLINFDEFFRHAEKQGLDDAYFWDMLSKHNQFTDEEYKIYADANRAEVNQWIDEGKITLPETGIVEHKDEEGKRLHSYHEGTKIL